MNDDGHVIVALEPHEIGKDSGDVFVLVDPAGGEIVQLIYIGRRALLRGRRGQGLICRSKMHNVLVVCREQQRREYAGIDDRKLRHMPVRLVGSIADGVAVKNSQ